MFESTARFARTCTTLAIAIGIVGGVGLVDRLFALPLAGLLLLFALLAHVIRIEGAEQPPEPTPIPPPTLPEPTPIPPPARNPTPPPIPTPPAPPVPRTVERTFRLTASVAAQQVWLVGEFNDWSRHATPMRREGDAFVATVTLQPGRSYRYRYLLDGERWENDWSADRYVPNAFGGDDSVVDVPA